MREWAREGHSSYTQPWYLPPWCPFSQISEDFSPWVVSWVGCLRVRASNSL